MSDGEPPTVAPATVDDVDDVADLWVALAAGQRRHGSTLLAEANRSAVREWIARSAVTGELLVARDGDGGLVGFVSYALDREGYERERVRGTVSNLFVVPERRGEGIGADLLDAAERALAAAGADAVALEALADNDRARAFYTDRGYDLHRVELTKPLSEPDGAAGVGESENGVGDVSGVGNVSDTDGNVSGGDGDESAPD